MKQLVTVLMVALLMAIAGNAGAQIAQSQVTKFREATLDVITSVPRTMTYQGILKDSTGQPIPNVTQNIKFSIWDALEIGTEVWSEIVNGIETDNSGYFTATLSNIDIPFNEDYWLELEIDYEPLVPRQKLNMSAYSARSDTSECTVDIVDNIITSAKIVDGTIQLSDIGQNGADSGQVIKWDGNDWIASDESIGTPTWNWQDSSSHGPDSVLYADSSAFSTNAIYSVYADSATYADTSVYTIYADTANYVDLIGDTIYVGGIQIDPTTRYSEISGRNSVVDDCEDCYASSDACYFTLSVPHGATIIAIRAYVFCQSTLTMDLMKRAHSSNPWGGPPEASDDGYVIGTTTEGLSGYAPISITSFTEDIIDYENNAYVLRLYNPIVIVDIYSVIFEYVVVSPLP